MRSGPQDLAAQRLSDGRGADPRGCDARDPRYRPSAMGAPPSRRRRLGVDFLAALAALAVRAIGATWRVQRLGDDRAAPGEQILAAIWHRDAIAAAYVYRDRGYVIPVSLSRDGERADGVLARLGFGPSARGSSSRGAVSLVRQLVRRLREGRTVVVLTDGPRGPAGMVKPGIVALAALTGFPIQLAAFSARPQLRVGSWDRTYLPLPFARVVYAFGNPISVPKRLDAAGRERVRSELERSLAEVTAAVERRLDLLPNAVAREESQ